MILPVPTNPSTRRAVYNVYVIWRQGCLSGLTVRTVRAYNVLYMPCTSSEGKAVWAAWQYVQYVRTTCCIYRVRHLKARLSERPDSTYSTCVQRAPLLKTTDSAQADNSTYDVLLSWRQQTVLRLTTVRTVRTTCFSLEDNRQCSGWHQYVQYVRRALSSRQQTVPRLTTVRTVRTTCPSLEDNRQCSGWQVTEESMQICVTQRHFGDTDALCDVARAHSA
jgi:hypothetical protein